MIISLADFFAQIKLLNRKWQIRKNDQAIRLADNDTICPWVEWNGLHDFRELQFKDRIAVFRAADNTPGHNPEVRKALLKATNLL